MDITSLRFRLIAAAAVWVTAGFAGAFFLLSAIFREHVTEQFFEELFVHVQELERLSLETPDGVRLRSVFSDPRYDVPNSGFYWEIRDNEQVRLKSASLAAAQLGEIAHIRPLPDQPRLATTGPTGALLLTEIERVRPAGDIRSYIIGTDKRHLEILVQRFNRTLVTALLVLGLAMVSAAAAITAFGLAPFASLADALRRVRDGRTPKLEGRYPREVAPLVDELNDLIVSGRKSLETARAQAGSLAHALKTPLAIVTSEAYELEGRGEVGTADVIIDQCRTMQQHIDHHIARARATAMSHLPGVRSDVGATARSVVHALSRLHAGKGVTVKLDVQDGVVAVIDDQDLREILGNLIDNAFKHARTHIDVTAREHDGKLRIDVADDGTGVAPESRELVRQPGVRLSASTAGTGLGLAIVDDLVRHYRGELELGQSALGGLMATVTIEGSARPAA